MDEESLGDRDDMVNFNDLSEGPLLHNLRKRFTGSGTYARAYHSQARTPIDIYSIETVGHLRNLISAHAPSLPSRRQDLHERGVHPGGN